jgi:hypothetical protein
MPLTVLQDKPAMQSRRPYRSWKWSAMHQRRPFYFNLLQLYLTFQWLGIYHGLTKGNLSPGEKNHFQSSFHDLPFILSLIHAFTFLMTTFTQFGRTILQQMKGKRLCEWSAFSLVAVAYCSVLLHKNDPNRSLYNTSFVNFAMTSAISFLLFHYIGITEPVIIFVKVSLMIMWIYYLSISVRLSSTSAYHVPFS